MTEEEQLVKQLKASFPDMLDFNSNLKKLRTLWKEDERKRIMEIINDKFRLYQDDKIIYVDNLIFEIKQQIQQGEK